MEPGNHEPAESTDAFKSSFVMDTGKFRSWDWRSKLGGPYSPVTHRTARGAIATGMLHPLSKSSMGPSFIVRGPEVFDGTNHYIMMDYYQTVDGKLLHPLGHRSDGFRWIPMDYTIVGLMDSVGFVLGPVTVW